MQDRTGRTIRIGDRVRLWPDRYGRVVCSFDDKQFSSKFPNSSWQGIESGILVETDAGALFRYDELDEDFEIVVEQAARAGE